MVAVQKVRFFHRIFFLDGNKLIYLNYTNGQMNKKQHYQIKTWFKDYIFSDDQT